ncbi:sugar nucleotide-binding protein [Aurantimonas sp. MSK8Z-1]|uniref:SDR family oxidoreductase n=1 Tax=Mangrovibrevibacter kandeliae TaxID=2968473 RepID=UPI002118F242|nr:sugar nucleotide-binding protein [Aurantimonas sp. MSK8Z-1]MCW4117007.1 sugar nucleotide-binding protein [Aurantimonas sp. MSK8Z-1]
MLDCLVVGGNSPVGQALVGALRHRGARVGWTTRRPEDTAGVGLDLETLEGLDALPDADCVALVAAETKFAACAAEPERTRRINVDGPAAVARRAEGRGARVLFFSSVAVHDGIIDRPAESLRPQPTSVYGRQKLEAEDRLLATSASCVVLRPAKVVTPDFALFAAWAERLARGDAVEAFSDMVVAPVELELVAGVAAELALNRGASGIYQLSSRDQRSYADLASLLADRIGADPGRVTSVLAAERRSGEPTWLPRYARLGCERLTDLLGLTLPSADDTVLGFVARRHQAT